MGFEYVYLFRVTLCSEDRLTWHTANDLNKLRAIKKRKNASIPRMKMRTSVYWFEYKEKRMLYLLKISGAARWMLKSVMLETCFHFCDKSCCVLCRLCLVVDSRLSRHPHCQQFWTVQMDSSKALRLLFSLTVDKPPSDGCSLCFFHLFRPVVLKLSTPPPSKQNNLNDLEILALMIATLSHDLDHRGVNNSYIQRYGRG